MTPQRYDFPFTEGFEKYQPCEYWKNEFGEVTIQLSAYGNNAPLVAGKEYTLGYMPEGYRPKHQVYFVGFGNRYYQFYHISGAGEVRLLAREDVSPNTFNGATINYIAG